MHTDFSISVVLAGAIQRAALCKKLLVPRRTQTVLSRAWFVSSLKQPQLPNTLGDWCTRTFATICCNRATQRDSAWKKTRLIHIWFHKNQNSVHITPALLSSLLPHYTNSANPHKYCTTAEQKTQIRLIIIPLLVQLKCILGYSLSNFKVCSS